MNNYYNNLGLTLEADSKMIKDAYKKLVRKHNPQKDPEGFKTIREAYEILSNEKSKASYDSMLKHKDKIDKYRIKGEEALDSKNYSTAQMFFKKILVIEPKLTFARNLLGTAYLLNKEYDKAIKSFEKCIEDDDENYSYYFNLGLLYKAKENHNKAEENLIKAKELNPINPNIYLSLASLRYYQLNNYSGAVNILEEAIEYDNNIDFDDFQYYFKLIEINIFAKKEKELKSLINKVESVVPDDEYVREYVGVEFGNLAGQMFNAKLFDLAIEAAKIAKNFLPYDKDISQLLKTSEELSKAFESYERLEKDDNIIAPFKGLIALWLADDISERERNNYYDKLINDINYYGSEAIVRTIKRLKSRYPALYDLNSDFLDGIKNKAEKKNESDDLYIVLNKFKDDIYIIPAFKKLIALWLTDDIPDYERNSRYDNIMREIDNTYIEGILKSVKRIKSLYPTLYNLNSDFFEKIYKIANENLELKNSRPVSKNSTTSSSACYVATAAFGTPWAQEIDILRSWRDKVLRKKIIGRAFISFYYFVGPYTAKIVERSFLLKKISRFIIFKIIKRLDKIGFK